MGCRKLDISPLEKAPLELVYSAGSWREKTGVSYSYFGARYYDPNISIWLSVDPLSDKYPNLSPYTYTGNNPVRFIDPDGKAFGDPPWASQLVLGMERAGLSSEQASECLQQAGKNALRYGSPFEDLYALFTGKDFDGNEYNRGSALGWAALGMIPATKLSKLGRPVVTLTQKGISYALRNTSRLQHSYKHAKDIKQFKNLNWSKRTESQWRSFNEDILSNATKSFDNVLGDTKVKGFYKNVDGQNVATYIYAEGKNKGQIASTVVLNENQMKKFNLNE